MKNQLHVPAAPVALALAAVTLLAAPPSASAQIGPDAFGYTANSVSMAWEEVSTSPNFVMHGVDDSSVMAPIGFTFSFYGVPYTTVFISSNGMLTFGSGSFQVINEDLLTGDGPANLPTIAPLWDDWISLATPAASGVYYQTLGTAPNRRFVAQWHMYDHYSSTPSEVTFQVILSEANGSMLFQYLDMSTGNVSFDNGVSATVGIRNINSHLAANPNFNQRLQWSFNSGVITDGTAIIFSVNADDLDGDGILNDADNCPTSANPDQQDGDGDGVGDACDSCPGSDDGIDPDNDGIPSGCDNCPSNANADQGDCDGDGIGDACDGDQNGDSFESGSLAPNWTSIGPSGVVTASFGTAPFNGTHQALLATLAVTGASGAPATASAIETFLSLPAGAVNALTTNGGAPTVGAAMRRIVSVDAGDTIHFHWNFLTSETTPQGTYNDLSFVTVVTGSAVLLADTFSAGFVTSPTLFNEETGYHEFQYTFTSSGTVTIGFGVVNQGDSAVASGLLIDCVAMEAGTPPNQPPSCAGDFTAANANYLLGGQYVVTEGETISVPFTGTDPDGDALTATLSGPGALSVGNGPAPLTTTWSWTPAAADAASAPHTVSITFQDDDGETTTCSFVIADINLNPVAECTQASIVLECTSAAGAVATLNGSLSSDPDPEDANLLYHWDVSDTGVTLDNDESAIATGTFPLGTTMATLTVVDGRGGVDTCDVTVIVQDTVPPEVMCTTSIASLWPVNHSMYTVELMIVATDACAEPGEILPIIVTVSSDEPDDAAGNGDGATTGDINGSDGYAIPVVVTGLFAYDADAEAFVGTIQLRAERAGSGDGRKYTIDVLAFDDGNNVNSTSCCVVVPHDRRGQNN